jgi:hypothetical protein
MTIMRLRVFAAIVLLLLGACSRPQAETSPDGLAMETITIDADKGPVAFQVEVASDFASREKGLMFRKTMQPDHGMLFDFKVTQGVAFWMKNTILPLDMIFILPDGVISSVASDTKPFSTDEIPSAEPVRAVLEINAGRAAALGIVPGDVVHAAAFGNDPDR